VRDQVVDFVRYWSEKTEIGTGRFIHWLGVRASKFYDWRERYGRVNEVPETISYHSVSRGSCQNLQLLVSISNR
jgi:hypothetical protein